MQQKVIEERLYNEMKRKGEKEKKRRKKTRKWRKTAA
jgi:hypothetical protein